MNHLNILITNTKDFDKSIKKLLPPQREVHQYYENLSHSLIDYIYQCKEGSRDLYTEDDHLRNSLTIRELYRYVPQSKRCFPFESDPSSTDALIRQTRTTNIALQIRVQLCTLVSNPIGFAILTELIVHLRRCVTTDLRAARTPCFDICKILLVHLPFDNTKKNKHINIKGYLEYLGKRIIRTRYLQPTLGFHRATNEVNYHLVAPEAYEPLIRHLTTILDESRIISELPAHLAKRPDSPQEQRSSPADTPTNLTLSPIPSTDELDNVVTSGPKLLSSLIRNSVYRNSPKYQRTRHETAFYVWSSSDRQRIIDNTTSLDVRQCIFDIIDTDDLHKDFSINQTDYNPPSTPGLMLLKAFILEHFNYLEKAKHSSFKPHNTTRSYPTVHDSINLFHMITLCAENERIGNRDTPAIAEMINLMPTTYDTFSRPIYDRTREFSANVRRSIFWILSRYCTSFSYYAFLQICIHVLGPVLSLHEQHAILSVPFGTLDEFYASYPRANVHLIRMWNFFKNIDYDIANAPDAPEFLPKLYNYYKDLRSRSKPLLHDRFNTTYVNGLQYMNHTINFSSAYDNPLVHRSELDYQDGKLLARLGALFLPTYEACLQEIQLEEAERNAFNDSDYAQANEYYDYDGQYFDES